MFPKKYSTTIYASTCVIRYKVDILLTCVPRSKETMCTLPMKKTILVLKENVLQRVFYGLKENLRQHIQDLNKGLFINYVTHNWPLLDPPPKKKKKYPILSNVIFWLTPPLPSLGWCNLWTRYFIKICTLGKFKKHLDTNNPHIKVGGVEQTQHKCDFFFYIFISAITIRLHHVSYVRGQTKNGPSFSPPPRLCEVSLCHFYIDPHPPCHSMSSFGWPPLPLVG